MKPQRLRQALQCALQHHQAGRFAEAENLYADLRREAPGNFDVVHLSGTLALQQGRYSDALSWLAAARRLDPRSAVCAMRHGIALSVLGRFAEAEAALRFAQSLDQRMPEIPFHHGFALWRLGRVDEAIASYERAIHLSPSYAEAHDRLGALLVSARGHAAAEPHLRRAAELQPKVATVWSNLGISLAYLGRLSEALGCFDRALAANAKLDHAYAGRGLTLSKMYRQTEAIQAYGRAIEANPRNFEAHSARLCELHYVSELSKEDLFREHRAFGDEAEAAAGAPHPGDFPNRRDPERRLRLAFLSQDLRAHSVAYFIEPLLRHLDRERFEVVLYHDHFRVDATSERLGKMASVWRNFAGRTNESVEREIRADAPDLIVDLAGHSGLNRLPLFARRLAPVQVTYLGYPDTTGLLAVNYRLVDAITDPAGEADPFVTERLVRFAPTAWAYDPPAAAPEPIQARTGEIVFGCFNNFSKVNDQTLRNWGLLLEAVPGSRLLLKGHGLGVAALQAEARRRMEAVGIRPDRVELLDRTRTVEEHLAAYARIDVALDTFPYHGTTTTCEALWMGVPVVTLAGDRHASRVGASLLTAVGRPDWIAQDWAGYVRKAAELASGSRAQGASRGSLREAMRGCPLLDHSGQAARFGAALLEMWRGWCARPAVAA
jgi:predicted O-linked N-acetylglucosamine transferase (SPINDLY family)